MSWIFLRKRQSCGQRKTARVRLAKKARIGRVDKAKEQSLEELEAQIRVMAREADEQKWGQFIKEGVYKKWFHPEDPNVDVVKPTGSMTRTCDAVKGIP